MNKPTLHLPSTRALLAFDRVAKLGNVTRAAEQLHTSQAAISRHIRQLESDLGVTLITRDGRGIKLTPTGRGYAQDISEALTMLRQAAERVSTSNHELTIACTHEVSHLILMPRYAAIKQSLGASAHIRIITCDYKAIPTVIDDGADIVFEYRRTHPGQLSAAITKEEIVPAVSPALMAKANKKLNSCPNQWQGVPRLSLSKENSGWASWNDWFDAMGVSTPEAPEQLFHNYVYALEAATRGEGMVLAWRGFAERYFESGQLIPLRQAWSASGSTLFATATPNGLGKHLTKRCIKILSELPQMK